MELSTSSRDIVYARRRPVEASIPRVKSVLISRIRAPSLLEEQEILSILALLLGLLGFSILVKPEV